MQQDMRVLHVIEELGMGGAEKLLTTLLPHLHSRGISAEVAVLGQRCELATDLRENDIEVHVLGLSTFRAPLRAVHALCSLMKAKNYSLVHTHLTFANLYGRLAAVLSGLPVTSSYHDTDYEPEVFVDNPSLRKWKVKSIQAADTMMVRVCRKVVAVSEFVRKSIARRLALSGNDIEVIYNGIEDSAIMPVSEEDRTSCRRALGLSLSARVVLQVGRLTPQKGQLHTLQAAAALRNDRNIHWVLVGDGPLRGRLEKECENLHISDVVRFDGTQSDISTYLRAADVFVFPSLHEGLGIAAIEAMAAGLPVVAYRVGPLPEVVVDGQTGVLVRVGDTVELSRAVNLLLNDRQMAGALGEEGRRRVRERFLIQYAADGHAAYYEELLQRDGAYSAGQTSCV